MIASGYDTLLDSKILIFLDFDILMYLKVSDLYFSFSFFMYLFDPKYSIKINITQYY